MFRTLFVLFLLVPAIELYVLISVGGVIGALPTILLTVFTALLGAYLMRLQGIMTLQRAQQTLLMGQLPQIEVIESLLIFVGGLMLLIPGLITDFIGFVLLIPSIRQAMARHFLNARRYTANYTYEGQVDKDMTKDQSQRKIEVIEAEWVELDKDKNP